MKNEVIHQRILNTKNDIFPLDKFLPINSAYTIFHNNYDKEADKTTFLSNRKFLRLREGYYSIFVATAYSLATEKEHFLCFPENTGNDVFIVELSKTEESKAYEFDVKEFTAHSTSFGEFLIKSIFPRLELNRYDLIIGLHIGVSPTEQDEIIEHLKTINSKRMVYLVGVDSPDQESEDVCRVAALTCNGVVQNEVIDLRKHLSRLDPIIVFQDLVKFKKP